MYKILFAKYWDKSGQNYHLSLSIGIYNPILELDIRRNKFSISILRLRFHYENVPF